MGQEPTVLFYVYKHALFSSHIYLSSSFEMLGGNLVWDVSEEAQPQSLWEIPGQRKRMGLLR